MLPTVSAKNQCKLYIDVKMLCPATDLFFLFKDLLIFAVLELVFDIFVWSLHPCNLPSHHGMIDKWPKYSGHFLPNSSTANTKITVTQRHPNQEYSFKTRKNFFLGPHHNKTEKNFLQLHTNSHIPKIGPLYFRGSWQKSSWGRKG